MKPISKTVAGTCNRCSFAVGALAAPQGSAATIIAADLAPPGAALTVRCLAPPGDSSPPRSDAAAQGDALTGSRHMEQASRCPHAASPGTDGLMEVD